MSNRFKGGTYCYIATEHVPSCAMSYVIKSCHVVYSQWILSTLCKLKHWTVSYHVLIGNRDRSSGNGWFVNGPTTVYYIWWRWNVLNNLSITKKGDSHQVGRKNTFPDCPLFCWITWHPHVKWTKKTDKYPKCYSCLKLSYVKWEIYLVLVVTHEISLLSHHVCEAGNIDHCIDQSDWHAYIRARAMNTCTYTYCVWWWWAIEFRWLSDSSSVSVAIPPGKACERNASHYTD